MGELINIRTWDNYWPELSKEEKLDLIDVFSSWMPNPKIACRDESFNKMRTLQIAMSAAFRTHKYEQIDEALLYVGKKYGRTVDGDTSYESLLLTLLDISSNGGSSLDHFELLRQLADYYHFSTHEIEKALSFYHQAKKEIRNCYDEYSLIRRASKEDTRTHFKNFVFVYYRALLDANHFNESRMVEKELLEQWCPMTDKDIDIIHYYRYLRMTEEIKEWERGGAPIESLEEVESLIKPQPIYAANIFKSIAYFYYKRKDYPSAKVFYEKAYQCYPNLEGVNSKLQIINKKLSKG